MNWLMRGVWLGLALATLASLSLPSLLLSALVEGSELWAAAVVVLLAGLGFSTGCFFLILHLTLKQHDYRTDHPRPSSGPH